MLCSYTHFIMHFESRTATRSDSGIPNGYGSQIAHNSTSRMTLRQVLCSFLYLNHQYEWMKGPCPTISFVASPCLNTSRQGGSATDTAEFL